MATRKSSSKTSIKSTGTVAGDLAAAKSLTTGMDTSRINSAGTYSNLQKSSSAGTRTGSPTYNLDNPPATSKSTPGVVSSPTAAAGLPVGGVTPGSPVATSDSARTTYDALKERITELGKGTLDYASYLSQNNPLQALLGQQRDQLGKRRDQEIARITSEFNDRSAAQAQTQKSETGTQSMGLARMGGFDSASGQAVLTNLQRTHEAEQNTLMQARQSAILQAQQAYEDKDFALARMQIEEAKAAEAMMYQRQQDFIRNSLAIRGEERADAQMQLQYAQFEYGKKRDQLQDQRQAVDFALKHNIGTGFYFVGGIGYDTSTGEAIDYNEYIKRGGDPNFKNNVTTIEPGSEMERQFVIDLANKYPDAPIDILNDDVATARSRINGSRIYQEQVRPPSSGGGGNSKETLISQLLVSAKSNLDTQRAESGDGYANPNTYRENKTAYVSAGGTPTDFFQMFPPEVYIAPSNRKGDLDVYKNTAEDPLVQAFQQQFLAQ